MEAVATVLFLIVGGVNLLPLGGVLSSSRLQALYGVRLEDPNLVVLLRHRAVLLGIVGALLVAAAFHAPLRSAATAAGLVSMLSFVVLARRVGGLAAQLRRVVVVDLAASALLVVASLVTLGSNARPAA